MPATKSELKSIARYQKRNIHQIPLRINIRTESDLLAHIRAQPNVNGYIKSLIRADMNAQSK